MQVKKEKQQNNLAAYLLQCGIPNNQILDAFNKIDFIKLNKNFNIENYIDNNIKFQDRYIIKPLLLAELLNLLEPQKNDRILELFPGNFYSTFILGELVSYITVLENKIEFIENAKNSNYYKKSSNKINIRNKLAKGLKFDKIIIYGAINNFDLNLLSHLDNLGILIYISYEDSELYEINHFAKIKIIKKQNDKITERTISTTQIFSINNEIEHVYN